MTEAICNAAKQSSSFKGWNPTKIAAESETAVGYTNRQEVINLATDDGAVVTLVAKWADTWYVDATAGNDANEGVAPEQAFQTIQHAVNQSVDGMTIVVADGTYAPIRTDNRSITIRSVNGAEKTVIDGGYPAATNRCLYAGGLYGQTNTVIRGFTVQNGCTFGMSTINEADVAGGTLYDCLVRSNHCAGVGGGVMCSVMYDGVISDNEA